MDGFSGRELPYAWMFIVPAAITVIIGASLFKIGE
jgi:hypothetical protein